MLRVFTSTIPHSLTPDAFLPKRQLPHLHTVIQIIILLTAVTHTTVTMPHASLRIQLNCHLHKIST